MRWPSQLAVALGAMALLAGCSSSDPSGPDKGAGRDGVRATEGGEQERQESPEPVAEAGFDECQLFETEELAGIFGIPSLHITGRSVRPESNGGRETSCGYFSEDRPGLIDLWLHTVADTNEEEFFASFEGRDTGPVEDLGDRAEVLALSSPNREVVTRVLRVIDGDIGLVISYTYNDGPGGLPEIPDAELGEAVATTAFQALERMPEELTIPDGEPEGVCAEVDLAHAAEVLGEELVTARSVLSPTGSVRCDFSGNEAGLRVVLHTDPQTIANWSPPAGEISHPDVVDGARIDTELGYLQARVLSGDRLLVIDTAHSEAIGVPETPRPEDVELIRAVAAAVDG